MGMTSPPYFGLRDYQEDDQIGLEDSLSEYIDELVTVFDEIRRVLRPDGSFWLNLGDSYQDKQKMLVPHRVAIALQDAGWIVRNDVTWVKPNPMPQSVKDRLNTTTEQIFHLTPEPDYWYDLDVVRESHKSLRSSMSREKYADEDSERMANYGSGKTDAMEPHPSGKNPGDVFEVTTKPFPDAHFAVYPPELCEKPIQASCPPKVCAECGMPYDRDVERTTEYDHSTVAASSNPDRNDLNSGKGNDIRNGCYSEAEFNGWIQACNCDTDDTQPGIALDPFAGAGTTCMVAKDLGRRFIGVELNPEYVALAQKRLGLTVDNPEHIRDSDATGLDEFGSESESEVTL
jgi:DNA modification methylase